MILLLNKKIKFKKTKNYKENLLILMKNSFNQNKKKYLLKKYQKMNLEGKMFNNSLVN